MRSSRLASVALRALFTVGLAVSVPSAAAAAPRWEITQLTTDTAQHMQVGLSGDRVVWIGRVGGIYQVFTQKVGFDSSPSQLTSGAVDSEYPQVSGDRLVWQHNDGSSWQIYSQKIGVDVFPMQLTTGTNYQVHPLVSGDRLMWAGSDGAAEQLFTRKMGFESSPITLTADALGHSWYQLSGDRVVWTAYDGLYFQVYTAKMGVDAQRVPVSTGALGVWDPQVSGDRIVWADGTNYQVYTRKMGVDSQPVKLTNTVAGHDQLQVSGDRIVWQQQVGSVYQIFTMRVGDAQPSQVSTGTYGSQYPQVSGNRVVWEESDGANWQVFTKEIGVDAYPSQITTAAVNSRFPCVYGNRIAWLGVDNSGFDQVYSASVIIVPTAVALTTGSTSSLAYGGTFAIRGTLKSQGVGLVGKSVILQSALPGGTYKDTALRATTTAGGAFAFSVKPSTKTYYKVRFSGATGYEPSGPTSAVYAIPRSYVYTPVAPTYMYRTKVYSVYAYLKPKHAIGTYPVRIYKYRYVSGRWVSYGYTNAKAYYYNWTTTKCIAAIKLPYAGKWRLRAYAPADSGHTAAWSTAYDYVTVK